MGGAESGALASETPPNDADLSQVINAWPTLLESVGAGIVRHCQGDSAGRQVVSGAGLPLQSAF